MTEVTVNRKGLSGSTLKLMAMVIMLIDHVGATILYRMMLERGVTNGIPGRVLADELYHVYGVMRDIGRLAFPIYCFLLIEGFEKTRSKTKYAIRLAVFALVSEIPFDLAFNNQFLEFHYQNIFFTLLIGLMGMAVIDKVEKRIGFGIFSFLAGLFITVIAAGMGEILKTDYGAKGVLAIMLLYLFRRNKWAQTLVGCLAFLWETTAPLAFLLIWFYNGRRGWKLKYIFYIFYPLHLLVLYGICLFMGLGGYPMV